MMREMLVLDLEKKNKHDTHCGIMITMTKRLKSPSDKYLNIVADYNSGTYSVKTLCKKYGYSDRKSIYRILENMEDNYGVFVIHEKRGITLRKEDTSYIDKDIVIKKAESKLVSN